MSTLIQKSCRPLDKGTPPLSNDKIVELLKEIHQDWQHQPNPPELQRIFKFRNYYQTIGFVNALAWIAHQEDHHPELEVSYNRCVVHYSTHSIGGISENDFICASKIDRLMNNAL
jgi:4a-hydroxytetrahydrobiopterin dehydratase